MENILEVDLNDIVSKRIESKISSLENDLEKLKNANSLKSSEVIKLNNVIKKNETSLFLLNHLRSEFSQIKATSKDGDSSWFDSKEKNQFLFIENCLQNILNVAKEAKGWYCHGSDGFLKSHLAINYYSNKEVVINLLKALGVDCETIAFINSFKMPYDYSKEDVVEYVKFPKYNTNGYIFGISQYWINSGAGKSNMPHDLIMQNPFILEAEVFELLLNSIDKKAGEYYYLFALPKYNKNITKNQIQRLGERLINLKKDVINYDVVKNFIENNLKKFNEKTLDFLYQNIRSGNQFNTLHWENFPNNYQMKFLKSKSLDEVLKILTDYSCQWTVEEKYIFLKEYTNTANHS